MLSQTSDYALRAVLVLAREYERRSLRADEIARATGAPANYLSKTLNALAKAGVLKSARGPQGGFSLAIPPESLSLARVIDCFETRKPHTQCILGGGKCNPARPCAAHDRWTAINDARRATLTVSVASLIDDSIPEGLE
ncbi:MAG: RrF2 family transcriptional regulator [Gemmatimonadaceae bacterium]